jgi:pyruvate dehydrogenase E2 component (dihydrolipoamide acetyltransferase)
MADITMPQLGETVTEGTITKWFKQVGDEVAEDEPLFEVSTDKVDSEVPAPASGFLVEIRVPEGETVDVGAVLAVLGDSPPDGSGAGSDGGGESQEAPAPDDSAEGSTPEPAAEEATPEPASEPAPAPATAPAPAPEAPAPMRSGSDDSRLLSPVVRRLIAEHGLDPGTIEGTGVGGRITRNDVLAAVESGRGGAPASAAAPSAPAPSAPAPARSSASAPARSSAPAGATSHGPGHPSPARPQPVTIPPGERSVSIPHTNIRKRTAEHMIRSKQTSAHVYAAVEADFEAVDAVRRTHREAWRAEEGFALTYLPFVSRAVIDALRDFPELNASFTDDALVVHASVNLGFAVDLDYKGLMVPVVQEAETKRMRALAREIKDLADRARSKALTPDDIAGGTFTITNPGSAGTLITLPVINQPQIAILSTDGVKRRPVVVDLPDGSEAIAVHSVGTLALTWDHRAVDGLYASNFLARVREIIETRDWEAEL